MKNVLGSIVTTPQDAPGENITEKVNSDVEAPMEEKPAPDIQAGVAQAEAVTLLWSKSQLYVAYGLYGKLYSC
jgi:hypothetical protein